MPRGWTQRVQDSAHGLMEFRGKEGVAIDILRTPELQRLRRVRQLGLAYLVFPGAEHSRLVHSLGAAHLAIRFGRHLRDTLPGRLADYLCVDDDAIRDLAVAALCHDLGHGPLSHVWEHEVVGEEFDRSAWIKEFGIQGDSSLLTTAKWHEIVGHALLAWEDGALHQLLEQNEAGFSNRVRSMLRGEYYLPYLPRLLSGDIDADRADFLIRDAFQSGVAYGRFDLPWLISTSHVGWDDDDELVLGFDRRKATRVVEQFLIARAALYDTLYHHHTVRAAESMVGLFLRRVREANLPKRYETDRFLRPVSKIISGGVVSLRELLLLDDFQLWVFIQQVASDSRADRVAGDLARRIVSRELFKMVPVSSQDLERFKEREDHRERMIRAIEPFVPGEPDFYFHLDTARFWFFSPERSEEGHLLDTDGRAVRLRNVDPLGAYPQGEQETVRLFTIGGEAVEALEKLIAAK